MPDIFSDLNFALSSYLGLSPPIFPPDGPLRGQRFLCSDCCILVNLNLAGPQPKRLRILPHMRSFRRRGLQDCTISLYLIKVKSGVPATLDFPALTNHDSMTCAGHWPYTHDQQGHLQEQQSKGYLGEEDQVAHFIFHVAHMPCFLLGWSTRGSCRPLAACFRGAPAGTAARRRQRPRASPAR